MAKAWSGPCRELVVDPDARHTVDNATNALDDLARTGATTVVVVTSRWHAPRARAVFAWVMRGTGTHVVTSSPDGPAALRRRAGEALRWVLLPLQLGSAERRRRANRS